MGNHKQTHQQQQQTNLILILVTSKYKNGFK